MRLFCISIISLPFLVHAEYSASLSLTPKTPEPYTETTITLASYSFDVNTAFIIWTINGTTVLSGQGEKVLVTTTGSIGETSNIHVQARLADGSTVDLDQTLTPQGVALVWESPESYVPPFYEGRSLPGEGATIHLVAIPSMSSGGVPTPPESVSYSWFVNDQFMSGSSGLGKQSANLRLDYLARESVIKVLARDAYNNTAIKKITIIPSVAQPTFYLYDPVLGTDYATSLGTRFELTKESTISFVPYFFSKNGSLGQTTSYIWKLDGSPLSPTTNATLTLKPGESASGYKTLHVLIENSKRTLQKAQASLTLVFDSR